jgi:hypothetical protein
MPAPLTIAAFLLACTCIGLFTALAMCGAIARVERDEAGGGVE